MEFPVIELEPFLLHRQRQGEGEGDGEEDLSQELRQLCAQVASCLRETGALVIRDPRCQARHNDRFLDMMELYFQHPHDFKLEQARPNLYYQVGVTPEGVETPRIVFDKKIVELASKLPEESKPRIPTGPDVKWRYMWRVGPRPEKTKFQELNAEPVVPDGFSSWIETMDGWGKKMIAAVEVVAEMVAIGFGLPCKSFTSLMFMGPHLLAPTGTDLSKYGKEGTILAGYHYDLNFLTIHGRSRFPGLFIWLNDGRKVEVRVPDGCLLLQAGKQLEWLTGGECAAGMHEVVVSEKTVSAIDSAKESGRSLWRVSSTVFGHIASDAVLQPLGHFAHSPEAYKYPPTVCGDYVRKEISVIKLKGGLKPEGENLERS